jgi:hypothetical protein
MEGQRGRAPAAAVALRPVVLLERPKAPRHLGGDLAHEWAEIVAAMPADHFPRETWPMLEAYCRHIICARKVAALIEQLEAAGVESGELNTREWQRLLSLQDREDRAISDLAMKMRLSQSSRHDKSKPRRSSGVLKPWES